MRAEASALSACCSDRCPLATCAEWIDGNGNSESAPHAEYFYADGTVSSNPGFSLSEVFITCPTEVAACQAENAVCEGELATATDPLRGADAEWPTGTRPLAFCGLRCRADRALCNVRRLGRVPGCDRVRQRRHHGPLKNQLHMGTLKAERRR